jgi:polyisoprenyl-phosphate glycosyltransferase
MLNCVPEHPLAEQIMISVVIPILNEQENLDSLYNRLRLAADTWGDSWEIVFVDDGSTDNSLSILHRLNKIDSRVRCISFSRNFGHQTAVTAGLRYTRGDGVVIMDADLQDPPEEVRRFIEKWREGYQVVYGIRLKRKENALKRSAYYLFYRLLARLAPIKIPLDSGDFCLMDRVIVDRLNSLPERNRFVRGLRSWVGYRQIGVTYERQGRFAGDVKYTFRKLIRLAADGIINFSYRPLQIIAGFGFLAAALSFVTLVFMFLAWVFDFKVRGISVSQLPGYTSIILSVLFIGGIQLVSLGILGEYIGRIFEEVKQRPLFIVRSSIGFPDQQIDDGRSSPVIVADRGA